MKKTLVILLALMLLLALAACGDPSASSGETDGGEAGGGDFKIGIITGTVAQGEEEFRAAQEMVEKYGADRIVTATYPDTFPQEQDTTIQRVQELANTEGVKAIVFVQAVQGAIASISKVKEEHPDILFFCGVPGEAPAQIAEVADICINTDDLTMGVEMIKQAKKQGAETFVHISFPRHLGMENIARRRDLLEQTCATEGLIFVEKEAPDPTAEGGTTAAQKAISENVPIWVNELGVNTAFFSTNCSMQEPLLAAVAETGAISPQQCCPSPLHGYPGAFGISVPDDKKGDMDYVIGEIKAAMAEKNVDGSRMSTWSVPANMTMVRAGVEYCMAYLNGEFTEKNSSEGLNKAVENNAGGSGFTLKPYVTAEGETLDNYYMLLFEYIDFSS